MSLEQALAENTAALKELAALLSKAGITPANKPAASDDDAEETPKRRGRPAANKADDDAEEAPKRRGRPPANKADDDAESAKPAPKKGASVSVDDCAKVVTTYVGGAGDDEDERAERKSKTVKVLKKYGADAVTAKGDKKGLDPADFAAFVKDMKALIAASEAEDEDEDDLT